MSGSLDWTAFLFGSSDPGNAITVDKPPLSIWIMSLSVRLFGLNSWSLLLPQAFMGVASVYLLYRIVQKHFGPATGLLSGIFFAVTPVATVIFRYNNPDALLTLLMVGIAFFTLESIDRGQLRWLLLAGVLTGAAFLTKQLQILLLLPSVGVSYAAFARTSMVRRSLQLAGALTAAVMAAGWWLLIVQLTDPSKRPFLGGSRDNSVAELTLGYNGLDRLTGAGANSAIVGEVGKSTEKLEVGFQRFLQPGFSGQFGWFLPLAIAGIFVSFWYLWRRKGDKTARALLLFCCVWLSCAVIVVAYMSGIVHPYYVLTAVPPLCCLAAVAFMHFLKGLRRRRIRILAGITLAGSMFFAYISAARSTEDFPGFAGVLLVVWGLVIGAVLVRPPRKVIAQLTTGALLGALILGPVVWSINTVLSPHIGAGVIGGPDLLGLRSDDREHAPPDVLTDLVSVMYGELPSTAQLQRLHATPASATWVSAVVGSETAANYQLETGRAVLPLGGFDGKDPFPTLEQFKDLVDQGRVGSVLIQRLPPRTLEGRGESAKIVEWVRANFAAEKIDGADYFPLIK
ncbi:ArnT family glycosyltransferase [Arthrobacter sp. 92]|uniref:ArnT family glycosyltransferase n=1 Tax=Arthrobacter sp. 92 TaxID=3418175 RepID=UPI003D065B0E